MGIKTYNPYTPSRRHMTGSDFSEITTSTPEKSLVVSLKKNAGRNNQGTKADVVLMLDLGQQMYTSMTYSVQYSLADNMQRAGMNTLMGIGIVFLMLVFLSFVIGLFKYIEKFQNVGKKKAAEEAPKAEEDFADDLELVAVISAAIAAYENTSGDSFVVRSIKKSNKWHRA